MTYMAAMPIALRMSYSTKIDLPITTHHYPPEDKNKFISLFTPKDESKTKESILYFYSHNITMV